MIRKLIVGAIVVNFVFMLASLITPIGIRLNDTAIADNTTAPYTASATVEEQLELNAELYKLLADGSDIDWDSGIQSELNFGTLQPVPPEGPVLYMGGQQAYAVRMLPATSGRAYNVQFTGEKLTGDQGGTIGDGADNDPESTQDAYLVVPDYQHLDCWDGDDCENTPQGPPPGTVGYVSRVAEATNHDLYESGSAGLSRFVRAYLGVGGPPGEGQDPIQSCSGGHNGDDCIGEQPFYEGAAWDLVKPDQRAGEYSGLVTFTLTLS